MNNTDQAHNWLSDGHTVTLLLHCYGVDLRWTCPYSGLTFAPDTDADSLPNCRVNLQEDESINPADTSLSFCNPGEYFDQDSIYALDMDGVLLNAYFMPKENPFPVEYRWHLDHMLWRPVNA